MTNGNVKTISMRIVLMMSAILFAVHCGRGDVDLSKAKKLGVEVATGPDGKPYIPGDNPKGVTLNPLFSYAPGSSYPLGGFGAVDPVGTTLETDFDGDGIPNNKEKTNNIWVADYPVIESQIAPPVSMQIKLMQSGSESTESISSDITSDDFESRKNEGSEKFHQNETAEKTVQYQRSVSASSSSSSNSSNSSSNSSSSSSSSSSASAGGGGFGFSLPSINLSSNSNSNSNSSTSNTSAYNASSQSSESTSVFEDRPFKNNVDRNASTVKADAAATKARKYRQDKRTKVTGEVSFGPNNGLVRAALFIKNQSVNMPVKVSNILCSLLFETPKGQLIPIQSFFLRNDDFSRFEVEVYGGSEFGPYVVELSGLNTAEVERSMALGYTPKIYIVDYTMTHVADSNYKAALSSNFTGNNLKIIEENAKGRTSLVKVIGPNMRQMYRIAAFDAATLTPTSDICKYDSYDASTLVSPGVPLYKALQRLKCQGVNVEFGHFVFDFTGTPLVGKMPRVYYYGIKAINGVSFSAPCETITGTDIFGNAGVDACLIRMKNFSQDDISNYNLWAVYANGRYFSSAEFAFVGPTDPTIKTFDGVTVATCGQNNSSGQPLPCGIPKIDGVTSKIWAGDNYDITLLRISDLFNALKRPGVNPLDTQAEQVFNTAWDMSELGEYPYQPAVKSTYLGKAGLGDQIELKFTLNNTNYLNPSFNTPTSINASSKYQTFSYDLKKETSKLFKIEEAIDFEINLGLGSEQQDWVNVLRLPANSGFSNCGKYWDHQKQEFTICLQLPSIPLSGPTPYTVNGVSPDGLLNLYIRSALSNATRRSVWPTPYNQVKKFDARLIEAVNKGATTFDIFGATSTDIAANDVVQIGNEMFSLFRDPNPESATLGAVTSLGDIYIIELTKTVGQAVSAGTVVNVGSFSGTLNDAIAANSTPRIKVKGVSGSLAAGVVASGETVDIGGNLYKVASVGVYKSAYRVTVPAIVFDHKENVRFAANGTLTEPAVEIVESDNFVADWSTENPLRWLIDDAYSVSTNCPTDFVGPKCYGYNTSRVASNWVGASILENNWADGSRWRDYFSGSQGNQFPIFIHTNSGQSLRLASTLEPPPIENFSTLTTDYPWGAMESDGRYAVHVARSPAGTSVLYSIFDMVTRSFVTGASEVAFTVNGSDNSPRVQNANLIVGNGKALLVWNYIYYDGSWNQQMRTYWRVVDMATGVLGNLNYDTNVGFSYYAGAAYAGNRFFLATQANLQVANVYVLANTTGDILAQNSMSGYLYSGQFKLRSQVIEATPTQFFVATYTYNASTITGSSVTAFDATSAVSQFTYAAGLTFPTIRVLDSSRLMVFTQGGNQPTAQATIIANNNGAVLTSAFGIPQAIALTDQFMDVLVLNGKVYIAYIGQSAIGKAVRLVSFPVNYSGSPSLSPVDLQTTSITYAPSGQTEWAKNLTLTAIDNNKAVALWTHKNAAGAQSVRGRYIDVINVRGLDSGDFRLDINDSNEHVSTGLAISTGSTLGLISYWSPGQLDFQLRNANYLNTLPAPLGILPTHRLNNFFVAPLVERNIALSARLKY